VAPVRAAKVGNPRTLGMTKRRGLLKGKGPLPRATRPTALLNPDERRINGALVEIQGVVRDLLEPVGDGISMVRTHAGKGAEDHEVESAMQDLDGHFPHLAFK
jgi:hypothetical protein